MCIFLGGGGDNRDEGRAGEGGKRYYANTGQRAPVVDAIQSTGTNPAREVGGGGGQERWSKWERWKARAQGVREGGKKARGMTTLFVRDYQGSTTSRTQALSMKKFTHYYFLRLNIYINYALAFLQCQHGQVRF